MVAPSFRLQIKAATPAAISIEEPFENVEENGFSIVDIDSQGVSVKMYNYLWSRDDLSSIPNLEAFKKLKV